MKTAKKIPRNAFSVGSALILTVVLTSLLAIVGVLFVMASRVDKMATSAISENRELDFAVETILTEISRELVLDVPGVAGQEYYDYPDANNAWLAVLEPYESSGNYHWRQVSDVYGKLTTNRDVQAEVIADYQLNIDEAHKADADGDGVADSRWVIVPDINSNKGKPIYVAVRIIDNGAMLNANTAYKFDPNDPNLTLFDKCGPGQSQINLLAVAGRPGDPPTWAEEMDLLAARANNGIEVDPLDLNAYEEEVIWRYGKPNVLYTPFDISDELELRYRFLLNHSDVDTRLEQWGGQFRKDTLSTPVTSGAGPLDAWFKRACDDGSIDPNYAYRHIVTTYNMDRIIDPNGEKMLNVNNISAANVNLLYRAIRAGLLDGEPGFVGADRLAAQLAVNMIDLRDSDAEVTVLSADSGTYYGLEVQPFISEIAFRINGENPHVSTLNHFAIELYNPLDADIPLGDFRLELRGQTGGLVRTVNLAGHAIPDISQFVITSSDDASDTFAVAGIIGYGGGREDPNLVLAEYAYVEGSDPPAYTLRERYDIYLIRSTPAGDIYLDKQETQDEWFNWDTVSNIQQYYARADNNWNVVYQNLVPTSRTLGSGNGLNGARRNYNFYDFANAEGELVSVGDIARTFTVGPSTDPSDMIGVQLAAEPAEELVRIDLSNPAFEKIFQYVTVLDPASDTIDNDGDGLLDETDRNLTPEFKVPGRINVNTAPWFVIARLPWMQPAIAQAIVRDRDTLGGFEGIGGLMRVPAMGYYAYDPAYRFIDLDGLPDPTGRDGAISDFEERDVIFARISNIITVRSDVFTAYILVRIDADGPQKRVMAILDRSNVYSTDDKVRIVALHAVADPR